MGGVGGWAADENVTLGEMVLSRRGCVGKNAAVGIDCKVAGPENSLKLRSIATA